LTETVDSPPAQAAANAPAHDIRVSVVVPSFNNSDILPTCLDALLAQDFPIEDYEIVIVDDGSTDDTRDAVSRYAGRSPEIRYCHQENQGPAAARNHGAREARGAIIMFTDDDCEPESNWISEMYRPFEESKGDVCAVKGAYRTRQTSLIAQFAQAEFENRYRKMRQAEHIDFVDTYAAAFKRDVFLALHGFDTRFPVANNEDVEFSYRMASHGHKMVFNPEAVVFHRHPDTLFSYLKLKFGRAYWRMAVYRAFPDKMKSDSYTPQTLKLQILLSFVLVASVVAGIVHRRYFLLTFSTAALFLVSALPFLTALLNLPLLEKLTARVKSFVREGLPARLQRQLTALAGHPALKRLRYAAKQVLRKLWRGFAALVRALLRSRAMGRTVRVARRAGQVVLCDLFPLASRGLWWLVRCPVLALAAGWRAAKRLRGRFYRLPVSRSICAGFGRLLRTRVCFVVIAFIMLLLRGLAMGFGVLWGLHSQQAHLGRFTQALVLFASDVVGILLACLASYGTATYILNLMPGTPAHPLALYLPFIPMWAVFLLVVFFMSGLYKPYRGLSQINEFVLLNKSVMGTTVIAIVALYLSAAPLSKLTVFLAAFYTLTLVPLMRWLSRSAYAACVTDKDQDSRSRVLIVGTGEIARLICQKLQRTAGLDTEIVGLVDRDPDRIGESIDDHKVIGSFEDLGAIIETQNIEEVFVSLPMLPQEEVIALVDRHSNREGVHFHIISNLFDLISAEIDIASYSNIPITYLRNERMALLQIFVKRVFDIAVSTAVILFTFPFWALIMVAIRLDSDGRAIFKQQRVGKDGKVFSIYKFRTMHSNSERFEYSPSTPDDERITKVGRFLRKTSLDEFPQFINILKGEMSLVGPRPEMPFIVAQYNEWQRQRLKVKPGLTGLWQIMGRKDLPLHDSLEYDFYYIKNQSLLLDLTLLVKTIPKVLLGKGAY